jgi:hypothetical protein
MEYKKLDLDDPLNKAIFDFENALRKIKGKANPLILLTEDMTREEKELECYGALLKEGYSPHEAETKFGIFFGCVSSRCHGFHQFIGTKGQK